MKIFGLTITRAKSAAQGLQNVDSGGGGWFRIIGESFAGAWQAVMPIAAQKEILAFSAVYACVTQIAGDISKLRPKLRKDDDNGVSTEVKTGSPFLAVLTKPNHYQTIIKFVEQWIVSKLLFGNVYVLKVRDRRGVIKQLYILNPSRVKVLVADSGDVYYELSPDNLSGLQEKITVPASEIIHDMMVSLWHPLVGVSPIFACGMSASMGIKIQHNSNRFFGNMSRPSGMLSAPGKINDETAERLKKDWEEKFAGENIGRLAVAGDGLTYLPLVIPASDAQLIEQLKFSVEDVARCFHMPLYKIGGVPPQRTSLESLDQGYYSDCLQALIESAELCLEEGLELPPEFCIEFDLDGLMRMDTAARYDAYSKGVNGGWLDPNTPRRKENLPPVAGGDTPYLQQQNFSLSALAKRDAKDNPFEGPAAKPAANDPGPAAQAQPDPAAAEEQAAQRLTDALIGRLMAATPILEDADA